MAAPEPQHVMRKKTRKTLITLLVLFLLFVGYVGLVEWERSKTELHDGVATIQDFRVLMDASRDCRYAVFTKDGKTYFEARKYMPLWTQRSGPSRYVFGNDGKLLDWISDIARKDKWNRRWGQANWTPTTFYEIEKQLTERRNDATESDASATRR